ncbi:hypothetical protein Taro_035540 [Colocasia esculenta]|uniref:Ubiquitin-like protease family profile domain-containing protein n=1 Tax=Colocasia esculenta TaxID=4460 RepID=A0A843W601_COLES|nr:hypothetical protein [Colocasia esculenta]
MKSSTQGKVASWIKHKNVFTKKYTFVPICVWEHWSLLILCHLEESSPINPPVMLLLDSLHNADPTRLFGEIKKFVFCIYAAKGREESEEEIASIPLLVPQQVNGTECGFFVLCYIYLFIKSVPHSFSLNDYPYFRLYLAAVANKPVPPTFDRAISLLFRQWLERGEIPNFLPRLVVYDGLVRFGHVSVLRLDDELVVGSDNDLLLAADDADKHQCLAGLLVVLLHCELANLLDVGVLDISNGLIAADPHLEGALNNLHVNICDDVQE